MGGLMRRGGFLVTAVLLLLLGAVSVFAQEPDEDEDSSRPALLNLYSQPDGTTQVSLYSPVAIAETTGLREALGSALHCNLVPMPPPDYSAQIPDPTQRERYRKAQEQVAARQLRAVCPSLLQHHGMRSSLDLSFHDVLAILRSNKVDDLTITLTYQGLYNLRAEKRQPITSYYGMLTFQLPVATDDGRIHLDWGYQEADIFPPMLIAALFVVLPCSLILWMRSRALHLHTTDRAGAWFSYIRTQHLCTNAALLIWIGGGYSVRSLFANILTAALGPHSARAAALSIGYFILPPLLVLLVSVLASYRVMVEVRQVPWRFRDFFGLQIAQLGMILVPVLGVYSGIQLMGDFRWLAWGTIIVSFWSFPLAVYLRRKLTGRYPEPVVSGEFHDRIFQLARRAGVTLRGIFLLPSGRLPVANAFAAGNGIVMVTDYILQKLNRREVEAVAAHEIGHLQYKHPRKLALALLGVILLPIFIRTIFPTFFYTMLAFSPSRARISPWGASDGLGYPALDFVVAILCLLMFYAMSRRFERIADERSVTLTDDPEALITAFTKLSVLNLTPMQWGRTSDALLSHPSTLQRIRRIARAGNVSEDRMQMLLANPTAHDEPGAPVPTFESPRPASEFVYPIREQAQRAQVNLLILITVSIALPTLFAYLARKWSADFGHQWPILLAGFFITFAVYAAVYLWRVSGGRQSLRKRFEAHVRKLYPALDISHARMGGYSPAPWPRFYYVQSYWDSGLLVPAREGLVYIGDQVKFLLPYSSIQECVFADGTPAWWKLRRTYIRWQHGDQRGVMNLVSIDPCSPFGMDASNQSLNEAIARWRSAANSLPSLPSECASLGLPAAPPLKSKTPREAYPFRAAIRLTFFAAIPGMLLANFAFLSNLNATALLPIFYIPGTVFLLRFLEWLPYARYKDRPLSSEWTNPSKVVEKPATISPTT